MDEIERVIRVRAEGLLGRKLRTALTAIAIVLGVAMVSGTYVLTDSIDQAFDSIFTDVREGSDAVITGKSAFDLSRRAAASTAPTFDESLLATVRRAERRGRRGRRRRRGAADRRRREGDRLRRRAQPRLQHRERRLALQPAHARRGRLARANEVVIDESTADKEDFEVGDTIGVQARGPGRAAADLRARPVRRGLDDRRRDARRLRPADRAAALRQGRAARRDRGRGAARRLGPELACDQPVLPPTTQVRTAQAQARRTPSDTNEFISFLQALPARVRRDRALRRQLRDRELALDHDRAADARVRDDPDARRLAPAGARLDRDRGARRRRPRLGDRPLPRPRAREGPLLRSSTPSASRCRTAGLVFEPRTIVVALLVGILVTLVASLRPAIRATRVPPIAAVREGATLPESRFARFRDAGSILLTARASPRSLFGLFGPDLGTTGAAR